MGHNFRGNYCYCDKPEDAEEDEMLHCTRCEDWFHWSCVSGCTLEEKSPPDFATFLCRPCADACSPLLPYASHVTQSDSNKRRKTEEGACSRIHSTVDLGDLKGVFFGEGWADQLCRCPQCETMYKDLDMAHLFEDVDDINNVAISDDVPVSSSYSTDGMLHNLLQKTNAVTAIDVIEQQTRFHQAIKAHLLASLRNSDSNVITEVQMRDVIARAKGEIRLQNLL